jgi:hypothetical protein
MDAVRPEADPKDRAFALHRKLVKECACSVIASYASSGSQHTRIEQVNAIAAAADIIGAATASGDNVFHR